MEISRLSKEAIEESDNLSWRIGIGTTALCVLMLTVFSLLISRSIVRPLQKTVDMFRDIAEGEGDLTNISSVNQAAAEMAKSSIQVNGKANELSNMADRLEKLVVRFKI